MHLVSWRIGASGSPRIGARLRSTNEVLDFRHPAVGLPAPAEPLGWYDLDQPSLPAARDLLARVEGDATLAGRFRAEGAIVPAAAITLLAPVPRPGKVVCIGLNYRDHAAESGMALPKSPVIFSKFATSVVGPLAPVAIPIGCTQPDYEAELAFVVGRRAQRVAEADALRHVLGYTNFNDVSARDFQFGDGQWVRGKGCDGFAPMGEAIVTADEIPDPHALRIRFRLNGRTLQDSNTNQLVFGIPALVAFLSTFITLEPGDVVATGTPPGVGFARKPPIYLAPGDVMEVEIEGLGILRNPVVAPH